MLVGCNDITGHSISKAISVRENVAKNEKLISSLNTDVRLMFTSSLKGR